MTLVLQDASAIADDAPSLHFGPFRGTVIAPPPHDGTRGQGRKFHHLRNVPMVTDNRTARELILRFGGLVRSIASEPKFSVHRQALMDRDDMYSVGCAIMIQTVEMYEEGRGTKLSTWVAFRVRQGLMAVVKELHGSLREDGGRTARGEEIGYASGAEPAPKVFLRSLSEELRYGNGKSGSPSDSTTLLDTIEDESEPVDERLEANQEREWLLNALANCCTPIERDVVLRVLSGEPGQSIGQRYQITRQRVDQLHQGAIEKLRKRRKLEDMKRERALRTVTA